MYKLIATDIDGTLVNSKKVITPMTRDALISAQEAGAKIVLASGRPICSMTHLADDLRMNDFGGYVIAFNGGQVTEYKTGKRIQDTMLPDNILPTLLRYARWAGMAFATYTDTLLYTDNPEDEYIKIAAKTNFNLQVTKADSIENGRWETEDGKWIHSLYKILIAGEPSQLVALEERMQHDLGSEVNIFRSQPFFLECVPLNANKGKGLEAICRHEGIIKEDIIAFGDNYNDLSMLEFAGTGVAMDNADDEIKNVANATTSSNENDGIALFLNKNKRP